MKSIRTILILQILTMTLVLAQSNSPLYQVMTTNSLINRPEVFREMQENLDEEFGKKTPGLQIEGLHDAFGTVRQRIIEIVASPMVTFDKDTSRIIISSDTVSTPLQLRWSISIRLSKGMTLDKIWKSMKDDLTNQLSESLDKIVSSLGKTKTSAALTDALVDGLSRSDLVAGVEIKPYDDFSGTRKLSAILVAIMTTNIQQSAERNLPFSALNSKSEFEDLREFVQKRLADISARIRNRLINLVNDAESQLSSVIDDISTKLIAANSGVGITKGQGSFSGGVYVTAWHSVNWQFAAYANGQLNQGDSTKPTESLMGGHIRYGTESTQFDLLFAVLFGDKQFKAWSAGELGLGFSVRTSGVVVGPALYILGSEVMHPIFTLGATLKPVSAGGTGFLLGLQGQNGKWQPIVQTSFPILSN